MTKSMIKEYKTFKNNKLNIAISVATEEDIKKLDDQNINDLYNKIKKYL